MDEHKNKDAAQTYKERAGDLVVIEHNDKTRIVDCTASDVKIGSVLVETSGLRSSDHVATATGDCDRIRISDSAASDARVSSAGMEILEKATSDRVGIGDCEKAHIVFSAASDIGDGSAVKELSKETMTDRLACGDCERTRIVDSASSDVHDVSAVVKILKETANDHVDSGVCDITPDVSDAQTCNGVLQTSKGIDTDCVAGGDCEKTRLVDTTFSDFQIGSSVVKTWKETASDHVACTDGEKPRSVESTASDILVVVKDATMGSSTERGDAEEVGSCYGADVSVGAKHSDIPVPGVSARDSGDNGWGNVSKNGHRSLSESKKAGSEKETKDLVIGCDEIGDSGSKTNTKSDVEALELRSEGVVEKSGGTAETKEKISVDVHATIIEATDVGSSDVQNMAADGVMEVSTDEEIRVVPEEKLAVAAGKKKSDGKSRDEFVERGGFNVVEDLNSLETRLPKNELHDQRVESGETQASTEAKSELADEDITNIEAMDSDTFNENFCFSVEELQETVETADGSTEIHYDASADPKPSREPSQLLVAGGAVATENEISCKFCPVNSIVELEKGLNNQETDNGKAGLQEAKCEVETVCMGVVNITDLNSTSTHQVVNGEVMKINEIPVHVPRKDEELKLDESLDKIVEQESGADCLTIVERQISVLNSNSGLEVPKEGDYDLKFEGLNGNKTVINESFADAELIDSHEELKMKGEEQDTDSEEHKTTEEKLANQAAVSEITVKANEVTYQLPPDDEGEFDISDLVWGKVRSHPWWPGQIFDPSDASEKAMKYQKKDCFLVAYFGDRTFAWNDASLLKPFRSHFSLAEKQSNSETFHNAVNCALEEVSRRVEFGLACSCIPKDIYDKIKHQKVENAGIRQESSIQIGMEKSLSADLFEPGKLVEYMKALGQSPASGTDRLQIVVAKSQLLAYYRSRGYSELPEFQICGYLLENDDTSEIEDRLLASKSGFLKDNAITAPDQQNVQTQRSSYHKRKHNLKDSLNHKKKERRGTIGDLWNSVDEFGSDEKTSNNLLSHSFGKKRRGLNSLADVSEGRKTSSLARNSPVSVPKPSFKIGECIRRVASRMTASLSIRKSNTQKTDESSDGLVVDGSDVLVQHSVDAEMKSSTIPTECSSLDELLLQLHLSAQDPLKGYGFSTVIVSFFSDFRNAAIMEQREKILGKKRQQSTGGYPETFEFEDMNDTYWTDRVIQNGSEDQPPRKSRKCDNQLASGNPDKPRNKSNSWKRNSDSNQSLLAEKHVGYVDENAPAELVMHFPVADCVPSESRLIKMFKRFGPLKEIETEIDRDTNRARVVFKKCSDAESAYSSATKFNIFGSMPVNYQLNYKITVPFKNRTTSSSPREGR